MKARDRVTAYRPYVERALTDDEVRQNVKSAFDSVKTVYDDLFGGRRATAIAVRAATDEEIKENLRSAVTDLRSAAQRVQGKEASHTFRNWTLLVLGVALGAVFNPFTGRQTREWLKEKVLGPEQSFSYEEPTGDGSATAPPTSTEPASP